MKGTEIKVEALGVTDVSIDHFMTGNIVSEESSINSSDKTEELQPSCTAQSPINQIDTSKNLSPLINTQIKWKIPAKPFSTSRKPGSETLIPKKKYTPSDKLNFDKATFNYSSPYAVCNLPPTRQNNEIAKESVPKKKRQSLSKAAKVFDKANFAYNSPYGELFVLTTGRGVKGYGRKIQTEPTFDKQIFLIGKESAVRRSSIRLEEIRGLNEVDSNLQFEDDIDLTDDFKETVISVGKKPAEIGIDRIYRTMYTVSRTRNPGSRNHSRPNTPGKARISNCTFGSTRESLSTEGSTSPSDEIKNIPYFEELSDCEGVENEDEVANESEKENENENESENKSENENESENESESENENEGDNSGIIHNEEDGIIEVFAITTSTTVAADVSST